METLTWHTDEFTHIAAAQVELEDREARAGGPLLICDTDAFATAIWHERYLGFSSDVVRRAGDSVEHALYLVTDHRDVPFEQDGLRDGESIRGWMTGRFLELLRETGRPHVLLAGDREQRLRAAITATRGLLAGGWGFAAPFPPAAAR
jgi:HTH-type transcriptional regulator, transcriptional repressor of NAD biosynthesis genes